jgi:integrase
MTALAAARHIHTCTDEPEPLLSRLTAATSQDFLREAGWDPRSLVLTLSAAHPMLGWDVCAVPGCGAMVEGSKAAGLCATCGKHRAETGRVPTTSPKTFTIGEGTCRVGCPRPWESRRRPLCAAHEHRRGKVLKIPLEAFLARADVVPLPGFGACAVLACTRLRYSGTSPFCQAHQTRWTNQARLGPQPDRDKWCRTESAVAEEGRISLRGLPPLVVAEVLYGLQQRCAEGTKTHRAVLRPLCDRLRRIEVSSIADLEPPGRRQQRDLWRSLDTHCRRALSSPAEEQTKGRWDLMVLGHRGSLDFTVIGQPWLREAAKRWVAEDLPRRRGPNAANLWQYTLANLVELATSLRVQRDDHGELPAALGRSDIVAFTNRLAFLQHEGTLSPGRRIDILRNVRTVLDSARWQGLTRPGQPLAGLPDDFSVLKEDIPSKDRSDVPGRSLPIEIMRQLCQGLPAVTQVTTCQDAQLAIELLIDTGRRPEEICSLPWDCLKTDSQGKHVLLWDNLKCQRPGRELPITDATARLVAEQQQCVRARFPHTPAAELRLIPAPKMNPHGTKPFRPATLNEIHRAWVDSLPPLVIQLGGKEAKFDKQRVFPYAYRHTYAQRHADAGVPVDVLRELLDHESMDTTRGYYRVGAERRREAVDKVANHQFDRHGQRVWREAEALLDAERTRHAIGQVAVPYGTCHEPTNVQADGGSCPFRFRCVGCDHFRTDVSYLPDLTTYLQDLLRDRERILAATDLDEWARADALPSEEEIRKVRALVHRVREDLDGLTDEERAEIDQAVAVVRRTRQLVHLGMPQVRAPHPDLRLERP